MSYTQLTSYSEYAAASTKRPSHDCKVPKWFKAKSSQVITDALSVYFPRDICFLVDSFVDPPASVYIAKRVEFSKWAFLSLDHVCCGCCDLDGPCTCLYCTRFHESLNDFDRRNLDSIVDLNGKSESQKSVKQWSQFFTCTIWWYTTIFIVMWIILGPVLWSERAQTENWDSYPLYRNQHLKFYLPESQVSTSITTFATRLYSHSDYNICSGTIDADDSPLWIDPSILQDTHLTNSTNSTSSFNGMQIYQFLNDPNVLPSTSSTSQYSFDFNFYLEQNVKKTLTTQVALSLRLQAKTHVGITSTCSSKARLCIDGTCSVCSSTFNNVTFRTSQSSSDNDDSKQDINRATITWESSDYCTSAATVQCSNTIQLEHSMVDTSLGTLVDDYTVDRNNGPWLVLVGNPSYDLAFRSMHITSGIWQKGEALWFGGIWIPVLIVGPFIWFILYCIISVIPLWYFMHIHYTPVNRLYMSDEEAGWYRLWNHGVPRSFAKKNRQCLYVKYSDLDDLV